MISEKQLLKILPLLEEGRWIFTHKPIHSLYSVPQRTGPKPQGIWYGCGAEWAEFLISEMPDRLEEICCLYAIDVAAEEMFFIRDAATLQEFSDVYTLPSNNTSDRYVPKDWHVDWRRLSRAYAGIEICPYQGSLRRNLAWYYGWDVASGCIWDPSGVRSLTLMTGEHDGWRF